MAKLISQCPACDNKMRITSLYCSKCGMELKNDFELSIFDTLSEDKMNFLLSFLKSKGILSSVQQELGISYPTAKKKLEDLLCDLGLNDNKNILTEDEIKEMKKLFIKNGTSKSSEIVKSKLLECGGHTIVYTLRGLPCNIIASTDGVSFTSDKLPASKKFTYEIFDVIVDHLISCGGHSKKGCARNSRLGDPKCDESTVAGAIGYNYFKEKTGNSICDPVFVLSAVLEWAGIAKNENGELVLNGEYGATRK